jgi:hypothetical protein
MHGMLWAIFWSVLKWIPLACTRQVGTGDQLTMLRMLTSQILVRKLTRKGREAHRMLLTGVSTPHCVEICDMIETEWVQHISLETAGRGFCIQFLRKSDWPIETTKNDSDWLLRFFAWIQPVYNFTKMGFVLAPLGFLPSNLFLWKIFFTISDWLECFFFTKKKDSDNTRFREKYFFTTKKHMVLRSGRSHLQGARFHDALASIRRIRRPMCMFTRAHANSRIQLTHEKI